MSKDKQENKDTIKKEKSQVNIFDTTKAIIPETQRMFFPSWENKPKQTKNLISLHNTDILSTGNVLMIGSMAGVGKSSVCEALMANHINKNCDSFGLSVNLDVSRDKILYIDGEKSRGDSWNSWQRMNKRAGLEKPNVSNKVIFANAKAVAIKDRKDFVEKILNDNLDIGLVIFDGVTDFLTDTNSIHEAIAFRDWIYSFNSEISIIATIHITGTASGDCKPRGHIGSEIYRISECSLLLKKIDGGIREITTDFSYSKNRNDNDNFSSYYEFDEELDMFVTSSNLNKESSLFKASQIKKKNEKIEFINKIFEGKTTLSASYIYNQVAVMFNKEPDNAKKYWQKNIKPMLDETDKGFKKKTGE